MALERTKAIVKHAATESKADDLPILAGGVAFRIFLSIFPALIAAVAIFSLVTEPAELQGMLDQLRGILPGAALGLLEEQLGELTRGDGAGGFAIAGVLGGLWAATTAAAALVRALNRAYEVEERRNAMKLRGTALLLTGALFLAITALILLLVLGRFVNQVLLPDELAGTGVAVLVTAARLVASVLVLIALFAGVYWLGPNRTPRTFQWLTPGSVVGVLAWMLLSGGFAVYTRTIGGYAATYGGLAGVVVLLLWLQLSMLALLFGAELNQAWEAQRVRERDSGAPTPGSAPPRVSG